MLLAASMDWLREGIFAVYEGFICVVFTLGTMAWVLERTQKSPLRVPAWLGPVLFWAWAGWAFALSQWVLPSHLTFLELFQNKSPGDWWSWALGVGVWLMGALVLPGGVVLGGWWLARWLVRRKRRLARSGPWKTFEPIGYKLNWKQIFTIPAVVTYDNNRGEPVTTTVGKVLNEILPGRFNVPGEPEREEAPVPESESFMGDLSVKTPDGQTLRVESISGKEVASERFAAETVECVLTLLRITDKVSDCVLFLYEYEWWGYQETWGERHKFFVVHDDKIVLEKLELSSLCDDYFDHTVLRSMFVKEDWEKSDEDEVAAAGEGDETQELTFEQERLLAWWYRRFYTETRTGQLRVFWKEPLFHYSPPEHREAERDARLRRVERVVFGIAAYLVLHFVLKVF